MIQSEPSLGDKQREKLREGKQPFLGHIASY